jgi:hypothetical protein
MKEDIRCDNLVSRRTVFKTSAWLIGIAGGAGALLTATPFSPLYGQPKPKPITPADALKLVDACDTVTVRTDQVGLVNTSGWGVEIAFFQLIARDSEVWGPYIKDTQTFPSCIRVPAGTNCIVDPCRAESNPGRPIQGSTARASIRFIYYQNGQTDTRNEEAVAPAGKHWKHAVWTYSSLTDAAGKESRKLSFTGEAVDVKLK